MVNKKSWLHNIILGTCPRCRKGKMYQIQNPFRLRTVYNMKETCTSCSLKFKIEPSFFYGAMYVSYGLGVALGIAVFVLSYILLETTLIGSFVAIVITLLVLAPLLMRISRNIWINLFIDYNNNAKKI